MEWIYKKIWELKSKALTVENKERIQRLQQLLDNPTEAKSKHSTSEKVSNNNSANSNSSTDSKGSSKGSNTKEDIETFLFNRYNR